MLKEISQMPARAFRYIRPVNGDDDARRALAEVEGSLAREWKSDLARVTAAPTLDPQVNERMQSSVANLTDCYTAIKCLESSSTPVTAQRAADVIAEQIILTKQLIHQQGLQADEAMNISLKTLNFLFAAEQQLKSKYSVTGRSASRVKVHNPDPVSVSRRPSGVVMQLTSTMMFQLRQALFPAERMIVGAGRRDGKIIRIEALFDVTGIASMGGVKADPESLGQALIAMSQTGTYFALWVHSHPGHGPGGTQPSNIDLRQHADWLKNYSPDLVSAIMVADRHLRFWGTALETGSVSITFTGDGISLVSQPEHVYKLEA